MNLRIFAKDAVIYATGNIGLRASALLLMPIYAHFLTVSDFGLWATLQVTLLIMMIPTNLGMREAFVRYTTEFENRNRLHALFGTTSLLIVMSGVVVSLVCAGFLGPVFRSIFHRESVTDLVLLTGAASLAQALNIHVMSFYRARNLAVRYLIAGLSSAGTLLLTTLGFLWAFSPSVHTVLYAFIASYALVTAAVGFDVVARTGFGFDPASIRMLLRFGAPLVVSSTGQFAITGATTLLVSFFAGLEAVAIYALGYKFATVLTIVVVLPFQLAFQPLIFTNLEDPDVRRMTGRLLTYLVLMLAFMSFFVVVASRFFLDAAFPRAYGGAYLAVLLLVPSQALLGVHYFAETLLGAAQKTHVLAVLNFVAAVLTIAASLWLIPAFGWYGAVAASTLGMFLVCAAEIVIGVRSFHLGSHLEWGRLAGSTILLAASLAVLVALSGVGRAVFYGLSVVWVLGAVAALYFGPFCHDTERQFVRGAAGRLWARLKPRASQP